ncbi:hypothetical protein EK904_005682 [Melospiza melodia maxima]|nr:hypothetical protein EK904_005682 [Melospiza melodia maxima]
MEEWVQKSGMNEAWIPVHLSPNSSPLQSAVSHLMFPVWSPLPETQRAVLRCSKKILERTLIKAGSDEKDFTSVLYCKA